MDARTVQSDISRFYHRWHAYEVSRSDGGAYVIDFDYCPRAHLTNLEAPFASREAALDALEKLRERLSRCAPSDFRNGAYLGLKLAGSAGFLRILLGQHYDFEEYLNITMGVVPERVGKLELEQQFAYFSEWFSSRGISFTADRFPQYEAEYLIRPDAAFVERTKAEAQLWLERFSKRLGLPGDGSYRVESAYEDAFWFNSISGGIENGILLRINTHPRAYFSRNSATWLAAHEIGGHLLNVNALIASVRAGKLDESSMSLTVHACEAFQMEGLAQTAILLLSDPGELDDEVILEIELNAYHEAVLNNGHLRLEAGEAADVVVEEAERLCPFVRPGVVRADLRDRMASPLMRAYRHVYAPSYRWFMEASSLPSALRRSFMKRMYTEFLTPQQIRQILDDLTSLESPTTVRMAPGALVSSIRIRK